MTQAKEDGGTRWGTGRNRARESGLGVGGGGEEPNSLGIGTTNSDCAVCPDINGAAGDGGSLRRVSLEAEGSDCVGEEGCPGVSQAQEGHPLGRDHSDQNAGQQREALWPRLLSHKLKWGGGWGMEPSPSEAQEARQVSRPRPFLHEPEAATFPRVLGCCWSPF